MSTILSYYTPKNKYKNKDLLDVLAIIRERWLNQTIRYFLNGIEYCDDPTKAADVIVKTSSLEANIYHIDSKPIVRFFALGYSFENSKDIWGDVFNHHYYDTRSMDMVQKYENLADKIASLHESNHYYHVYLVNKDPFSHDYLQVVTELARKPKQNA